MSQDEYISRQDFNSFAQATYLDLQQVKNNSNLALSRLEAFIRFYVCTNDPKMEKVGALFYEFQELKSKVEEIMTKFTSVPDRVQAALLWNATAISLRIYADDLLLIPIIHAAGGVSKKVADEIKLLPHSSSFIKTFETYEQ